MKPNRLKYTIVRAAVDKGLREIRDNPRRGLRNLVDLGGMFAKGKYQKQFFDLAEKELTDPSSAYYKLIARVAKNIDTDHLTSFCLDVGYHAWTYGAQRIREVEEAEGFNVPWTILADAREFRADNARLLERVLEQGKALGIFCYIFFLDDNRDAADFLLELARRHGDCAILFFCRPACVDEALAGALRGHTNMCVNLSLDGEEAEVERAARILVQAQLMCGGYVHRPMPQAGALEELQRYASELELPFLFILDETNLSCGFDEGRAKAVMEQRKALRVPVFVVDFFQDVALVDRNISSEGCLAYLNMNGELMVENRENGGEKSMRSLEEMPLETALRQTLPKGN